MYERHFQFREKPFKLVPDPAFLYLGRSHREALAHLNYAMSQGEGFVEITGEVGTGKTTLCRAFLEGLDENTVAAYIFNPRLDACQLLDAINDEFGIRSTGGGVKGCIDALNAFLIRTRRKSGRVVVLIDEAQGLNGEVLEQLRLLSNLETPRSKLLQIILVGQPELSDMLDTPELRQLGQRITLACHLAPLSRAETGAYIRHRIQVASRKPRQLFTRRALGAVHRYSGGIPRLINIACDRALLTAFSEKRRRVTGAVARSAMRELIRHKRPGAPGPRRWTPLRVVAGALGLLAAAAVFFYDRQGTRTVREIVTTPPAVVSRAPVKPVAATDPPAGPNRAARTEGSVERLTAGHDRQSSRKAGLEAALAPWMEGAVPDLASDTGLDDRQFFELGARQHGLRVHRFSGDLELLVKLGLPAVLQLALPVQGERFAALVGAATGGVELALGEKRLRTDPETLARYWTGTVFVPWRNFYGIVGTVPRNADPDSVMALKMLLRDIGTTEITVDGSYDAAAREAVRRIQQKAGAVVDGVVGPLTKILLYNEAPSLPIPRLEGRTGEPAVGD